MNDRSGNIELPVLKLDGDRRAGTRMGLRRAIVLVVVHVLVAVHVWWFMEFGSAISPLEPSEAGHSIRTGAINAGAIFLLLLILSTLVFGRFFCGWACHVVAYQDAARWLLIKLGLRPKPVRARLLMLVPLFAVYWLFVRPLIDRWIASDTSGMSLHLTTTDFWATFPGPVITILTFLICGFVIVYFLGAKGFCTYGCPYGALFYYSDKVAPGRIRVNEDCTHTGNCTRTCSSNVNVASEVAKYGMVVDPGCMKCMDCVSGCPNDALYFGFGPLPHKAKRAVKQKQKEKRRKARPARRFDYTWPEEFAAVALFAALFWVYFNLYRVVPFLMAIGLCVVLVFLLLAAAQLIYRRDVSVQGWALRRGGKLTGGGWAMAGIGLVLVAATVHSTIVQYHTKAGLSDYDAAVQARVDGDVEQFESASSDAQAHLVAARRWGAFETRSVRALLGEMARWRGDLDEAIELLQEENASGRRNANVQLSLGLAQLEARKTEAAVETIRAAFDDEAPPRDRFARADSELQRLMNPELSELVWLTAMELRIELLHQAIETYPQHEEAAVRLCQLLAGGPVVALRDTDEAARIAEAVSEAAGRKNPMLLGMLAALQAMRGEPTRAVISAERAAERAEAIGDRELAADMRNAAAVYREQAASQGRNQG